ncbi:phosphoethanolamine transferase [Weeksellaceae bacterium KMM 9713]|uniref:Phosphoethanolamine transferase n=1 Tax=Profundicola chukchiensis TaxID=2961959 RepID=A0A9X4N013_9FLAO|nr:phosphoethanolamine transferase [Profundicola chukchiensis]
MYSSSVVTTYSIPSILTRATPQDLTIQEKEKTILDAFKETGYFTTYFANQNSPYPITRRLINVADENKINFFDVNVKDYYDGAILPDFKSALSTTPNKKFILIHTLGSHFRYTNRYPKEFEVFKPVMNEYGYSELNFENREKVINAYDNSVLYTDFFLSQLIESLKIKNKNAVLLYLSDHGENLFDNKLKIFGHGTVNPT